MSRLPAYPTHPSFPRRRESSYALTNNHWTTRHARPAGCPSVIQRVTRFCPGLRNTSPGITNSSGVSIISDHAGNALLFCRPAASADITPEVLFGSASYRDGNARCNTAKQVAVNMKTVSFSDRVQIESRVMSLLFFPVTLWQDFQNITASDCCYIE